MNRKITSDDMKRIGNGAQPISDAGLKPRKRTTKNDKVNERIDNIIGKIHGKYPNMIWLAKEYSKADLIAELEEIQEMLKLKKTE